MLKIKPNCERCNADLPANSQQAFICSYECTFCENCVKNILANVCPNCGGGFQRRPIRPQKAYRTNISLAFQPASTIRVNTTYTDAEIKHFSEAIVGTAPERR